ncbi:hypothetical protein PIB30_088204 [Stylosanthes scabra]|uniref:WEB family protein n=1 Tax=Stylosanthes scabra TaxID=79078 RepID=A0ABU6YU79_9FABA|nr:hypothetical protein [Stylosanthes scabra]
MAETREAPGDADEFGSGRDPVPGIRMVNFRADIDTSLPFESVKEAFNSIKAFDIKKAEEQAAELEKDLIVKELETLDVLEELAAAKRIVEGLKQKVQKQALKYFSTPDVNVNVHEQIGTPVIKEMNQESYGGVVNNQEEHTLQTSSSCSVLAPEVILMELKQVKMSLGRTISELKVIQSSVESLNNKVKMEKMFLERMREKYSSNFAAVSAQEREQLQARLDPPEPYVDTNCTFDNQTNFTGNFGSDYEKYSRKVETKGPKVSRPLPGCEEHGFSTKTAEMRWIAAKKMEEAAMAAEAIALAEMNVLKKVVDSKSQTDEANISKLTILKKLQEATEEVLHSKQTLADALNRVETANRKQRAAKEAMWRWITENDLKGQAVYNFTCCNKFNQAKKHKGCSLPPEVTKSTIPNNVPKPVLRNSVSMRDVLSRKQVPEGYATRKEMEEHTERQKVALSQMLRALREDLTLPLPAKVEKGESEQKQFEPQQRKRFGFIHISLPLSKPSKRRA